ncbi:hypothetical protein CF8_0071 [Aeromonas phage CF8]|nr:hypothetical protein CF8_0071 [Aeromonas phage CF8]
MDIKAQLDRIEQKLNLLLSKHLGLVNQLDGSQKDASHVHTGNLPPLNIFKCDRCEGDELEVIPHRVGSVRCKRCKQYVVINTTLSE